MQAVWCEEKPLKARLNQKDVKGGKVLLTDIRDFQI